MADTIVALATPTGRSGIGVVRLSGPQSITITKKLTGDEQFDPQPRTVHLKKLVEPTTGETIDEAVITYFKAPHSFTGEDVIEISCHGSPVLLRQVIDICLRLDARMAEPGEFSLRALGNGRINLAQAEAIRDLIDARTVASARQAVRQLGGEFSNQLQPIKDELLDVIVVMESALEFVEDDLPEMQAENVKNKLNHIATSIDRIASTFQAGRLIREGLKVALVGRPNVGKSSLFNALVGSERAIVTEIAGTTRDQIHEQFTINNIPVSLIDTAGLRETTDTVESIGVERSRRTMADADLVIVLLDASEPLTAEDQQILESVRELNHIVALNKVDRLNAEFKSEPGAIATGLFPNAELGVRTAEPDQAGGNTTGRECVPLTPAERGTPSAESGESNESERAHAPNQLPSWIRGVPEGRGDRDAEVLSDTIEKLTSALRTPRSAFHPVSAKTGKGLDDLQHAIVDPFAPEDVTTSGFLVTDARHHDLLLRARSEIEHSLDLMAQHTSEEITLIGLHNALRYLGQITGETTTEDMLTRIFSTFCIGK